MRAIIDWSANRARMILFFVVLSLAAGAFAYVSLPKEGTPDIDIPVLYVSVPFPGISATDSESLLVKPLETELESVAGLKSMTGTAAEGYAGILLEFDFDWDKEATIADVRDKTNRAAADFPDGADRYAIHEINISEFPIIVLALSGEVPERTLTAVAKELETEIESLPSVLSTSVVGYREEIIEVLIDPLKLEAYDQTATELAQALTLNNQLIAAGEIETPEGAFGVTIPSAFNDSSDITNLPIVTSGDGVITVGDLAEVRLTFEDRSGTARFNGEPAVVLQVSKKKGFNHLETVSAIRERVADVTAIWPRELRESVSVDFGLDQTQVVASMIRQLESSVLTAILMVMIVVVATLGMRSALLVGFAIPTSFLLCFAVMGVVGITISNIVMFGLILAVGMLVDGAIVVVEYADKEISRGTGPMRAYASAAKRMAWPIVSSTTTTLCAFLPMLFWPGVPGQFMGNLPKTLIFVLAASLLVALVYLPVVGGVSARLSRLQNLAAESLRRKVHWGFRLLGLAMSLAILFVGALLLVQGSLPAIAILMLGASSLVLTGASLSRRSRTPDLRRAYRRTLFGRVINFIVGNPVMPVVVILATAGVIASVVGYYMANNHGVEYFATTEPENGIVHVRARGNLSLAEKDVLVQSVEDRIQTIDGVASVFAFAGSGALNQSLQGTGPLDSIGQIQFELDPWEKRGAGTGFGIFETIGQSISGIPGVYTDLTVQERGPGSGKPVNLRLSGDNWDDLASAAETVSRKFAETEGLIAIEDTRPLPGIDWLINVDVERASRFGADVATVGSMVQMVTRGLKIGTMRVAGFQDEIDILARVPEKDRLLSTLDTLRVRTRDGLIPLSNFVTREPVRKLGTISRYNRSRYFEVKADVSAGTNANATIGQLTEWLTAEAGLPAGISWAWKGEREEQAESQAFLGKAFMGALGLMFVILLAQFNSLYNSILVLVAVVLSTTGVLLGMLIMEQPFSVIMTGIGIVALAGIVVNNNIVLIDTYSEYSRRMPIPQAIVRTAEARLRPVVLTTTTTMAGMTPLMLGLSIDFANGGYTINAPAAAWWKQLATAIVFGLGTATLLTLLLTPSLLALRYWVAQARVRLSRRARALVTGHDGRAARDIYLDRKARQQTEPQELLWVDPIWETEVDGSPDPDDHADDDRHDDEVRRKRKALIRRVV